MAGFALPAWATHASDVFSQYAPLSWVVAGFVGALIVVLIYAVWGFVRWRMIVGSIQAKAASPHAVNPLDSTFQSKRIHVPALAPPVGGVIAGKSFIDCEIVGPATIIWDRCTYNDNLGYVVDGAVIKHPRIARNGFVFKNCNFTRCKFYMLTVLVTEAAYPYFSGAHWGGINWVSYVPTDLDELVNPTSDENTRLQLDIAPKTQP
jgi:hypothetical protein